MSKSNPLFVDSTKLGSDSIGCRVELSGVEVADGESVYVKFCDASGFEESTQLQLHSEEPLYFGKIWLNHQQLVSYQFYVMGAEGIVRTSIPYEGKATYIIEQIWSESDSTELSIDLNQNPEDDASQKARDVEELGDLSSLIDKWGL